jgi:hypothetical protein
MPYRTSSPPQDTYRCTTPVGVKLPFKKRFPKTYDCIKGVVGLSIIAVGCLITYLVGLGVYSITPNKDIPIIALGICGIIILGVAICSVAGLINIAYSIGSSILEDKDG